ncbi:ATP-binding cassette domain-containing protein [Methylopila sp. Yamaguchi]|uniref:ATP-binding cassette domain-containing protein n=1 Tax=Methylopila sp. Yamaguchi TaxID=1437817 RepID=UPI000CC5FA34|nr:ATP-binding cassette domain-containing protein [Methylopila sp. Yamaguchi]GBD50566.1 ferrichrome ABC transporter ATPase [Methylopila sp. Yamaguchi]
MFFAHRAVRADANAAPSFELEGLTFAVDGRTLLQPLTLGFDGARVVGLIGHNGSGKSTLLKLIARQQQPTGGAVRFGGEPIASWGSRAFAREVAYLPQQPPAATGMTARELVALGRYPWHGALGRFGAADAAAVKTAMELTDIEPFADRLVEELSGGERQRVWLAMLVAQEASWLLLDEPTSALDVAHQVEVLALVRRLSEARGLGVIVVLHEINMAARFCDEIVALHSGRLIARGAPGEIVDPATLERIYGVPMEVISHPQTAAPLAFVR